MKLPRSIIKEYAAGNSALEIGIKHGVDPQSARKALLNFGVKMRPPGGGRQFRPNCLSREEITKILQMDNLDIPHADIGKRFNVTRERIRQICLEAGHKTRRERIIPKLYINLEKRIARQQAREKEIQEISRMWKAGMSFSDLAKFMGYQNYVAASGKISFLRKEYGKEMFPYRREQHWQFMTVKERADRVLAIADCWNKYADMRTIWKRFGYKSYNSTHASVNRLMKKWPHLFLTIDQIMERRLSE